MVVQAAPKIFDFNAQRGVMKKHSNQLFGERQSNKSVAYKHELEIVLVSTFTKNLNRAVLSNSEKSFRENKRN